MTAHSLHPDAAVSGLRDDCPACLEIARYPEARASADLRRRLEAGEVLTALDRRARAALLEIRGFDPPVSEEELDRLAAAVRLRRCAECSRAARNGHWPWCSRAPSDVRRNWRRGDDLRALRTIGRLS